MLNIYLKGIAFKKIFIGWGPDVYFDINSGRIICTGIKGTAIIAIFSFGIPASINFNPVTASEAENPICKNIFNISNL